MMVKKPTSSSKSTALAGVSEKTAAIAKAALRDEAVQRLHGLEKTLREVALAPVTGHSATMLKSIADFAQAQMVWAARQRLGKDVEDHGFGIKTEAMAELGRVMEKLPKAKGTRGTLAGKDASGGSKMIPPEDDVESLEKLGIDKQTANVARKLAALEPTELNAVVARDKTLAAVQREKKAVALDTRLALPDAKYRVLYADPPWQYGDTADAGAVQSQGAASHPHQRIVPSSAC